GGGVERRVGAKLEQQLPGLFGGRHRLDLHVAEPVKEQIGFEPFDVLGSGLDSEDAAAFADGARERDREHANVRADVGRHRPGPSATGASRSTPSRAWLTV